MLKTGMTTLLHLLLYGFFFHNIVGPPLSEHLFADK